MKISTILYTSLFALICGCNTNTSTSTSASTEIKDSTVVTIDTAAASLEVMDTVTKVVIVDTPTLVKDLSREILTLLKDSNYQKLSSHFHPVEEVRFSPYGYVDIKTHQQLSAAEFNQLAANKKVVYWGNFDGSGDSILLTIPQYRKRFIYNADFLKAPKNSYNSMIGKGNSLNNLVKVYPGSYFTENHFPGFKKEYAGMDWTSLRLVFKPYQNKLYLVAIVHDQWTS